MSARNFLLKKACFPHAFYCILLDFNELGQLIVDIIPAIPNCHRASAPAAAHHGNRFSAKAPQRKQEAIQLFILGLHRRNDIFLTLYCLQ